MHAFSGEFSVGVFDDFFGPTVQCLDVSYFFLFETKNNSIGNILVFNGWLLCVFVIMLLFERILSVNVGLEGVNGVFAPHPCWI